MMDVDEYKFWEIIYFISKEFSIDFGSSVVSVEFCQFYIDSLI